MLCAPLHALCSPLHALCSPLHALCSPLRATAHRWRCVAGVYDGAARAVSNTALAQLAPSAGGFAAGRDRSVEELLCKQPAAWGGDEAVAYFGRCAAGPGGGLELAEARLARVRAPGHTQCMGPLSPLPPRHRLFRGQPRLA